MKRINRDAYLNKLIEFKDKKVIKVITGIRRCGKSTIMEIYRDWLLANGVDRSQIVYVNFEDFDNYELRDPRALYSYVKPLLRNDSMLYVVGNETDYALKHHHIAQFLSGHDVLHHYSIVDTTKIITYCTL